MLKDAIPKQVVSSYVPQIRLGVRLGKDYVLPKPYTAEAFTCTLWHHAADASTCLIRPLTCLVEAL